MTPITRVVILVALFTALGSAGYAQDAPPPRPLLVPDSSVRAALAHWPAPLPLGPILPLSALNPLSPNPPILVDRTGRYWGELTTNPFRPDSISNPFGRYGSPYSLDSLSSRPLLPASLYIVLVPPPAPVPLLKLVPIPPLSPRSK